MLQKNSSFSQQPPFIFSENFSDIIRPDLKNWCLHLVCLNGTGGFIYNGTLYVVKKNDIVIAPHIERITEVKAGKHLKVSLVLGDLRFINSQLPENHYGIKGEHSLHNEPIIHGKKREVSRIRLDFLNIFHRLQDKENFYYKESLGAASLQMNYDLFEAHRRRDLEEDIKSGIPQGAASVVKNLTQILERGDALTHRDVTYYAKCLNVSPKYLSETVRRLTGKSVTYLINRYTGPIISKLLKNEKLSVSQIAYRMEFSSVSYFSRYTKRVLGVNPAEFRRKL